MNLGRINRFLVSAVLFAGLAAAVPAAAYTVKGMGKCSTWVGGTDDRFWLLGFISGVNYATNGDKGRNVPPDVIYRFVTRYCQENPNDDLADAITAFLRIH